MVRTRAIADNLNPCITEVDMWTHRREQLLARLRCQERIPKREGSYADRHSALPGNLSNLARERIGFGCPPVLPRSEPPRLAIVAIACKD